MPLPRLRQFVFVATALEAGTVLQNVLGLGAPFHDPGVEQFGLKNAVYAIGDQFIEIIVPTRADATAARYLERNGEGGYMVIAQVDDIEKTRARIDESGMRRVWNIDLEDISASHIHPADVGGAIVSVDEARPEPSWRWGGEGWEQRAGKGAIEAIIMESPDPEKLGDKWAAALGAERVPDAIELDDCDIVFAEGEREGVLMLSLDVPDPEGVMERARAAGLPCEEDDAYPHGAFGFCGVYVTLEKSDP